MLYVAEALSPTTHHAVYPFGPPEPGAISLAQGYVEALSGYSSALQAGEVVLPMGGNAYGMEATRERAEYRFMRAMIGAQSLPLDDSGYHQVVTKFVDASRAVDTGAIRMELTPEDFSFTLCDADGEVCGINASHLADCIRYIRDLPFEAAHDSYLKGALVHRLLAASEDWQVAQAVALATPLGYLPAERIDSGSARLDTAARIAAALFVPKKRLVTV